MSASASRQQAGASSSSAAFVQQRCRGIIFTRPIADRRRHVVLSASSRSGSSETFARDAQAAAERAFKKAKGKWESFAREQRLEERTSEVINKAGTSAREAADKARDSARRTFVQLDSEYELTTKTARAVKKAEEVARDIDQTYGVRRRVRSARDYVTRMWPTWKRELEAFSATFYGKVAIFAGICLLVSTPLFWSLLNIVLLLWWLSVPLSLLLLDYARKQQAQRLQQEAAEEAERARRAANPFAEMFRGAWGGGGSGGMSGGRSGAGATQRGYTQQDGPVIEAEWTSIDEGDSTDSAKGKQRR